MARLAGALGVRPGDTAVLGWLVALFAVTQSGHGLGSNTGDALFFVRFGVEFLPPMLVVAGATVMASTIGYAAAMSRVGVRRLLPVVSWTLAVVLVVERLLVISDVTAVYALVWLTEQVVVLVTFTVMWGAAAEACDARRAKRLFPLVASAGIAGGFVGNLATGPLAVALGTPNLLLVHAGLLGAAGLLLVGIGRRFFAPAAPDAAAVAADPAGRGAGALAQLRAGLTATRRSPLFRRTTVVAFAFSLLFFLVVVPFAEIVTASLGDDAEVAAFLGVFSAAATAGSFVVSLLVTNRLLARVGVVGVVLVVPVVYALGFSLWAVGFTLWTAVIVRGAQWIAVNALGATAWQSLFNVARPPVRGQVLAFVTAVPTQLGVMAAGAVLVLGIADLPIQWLSLTGAVIAAVTLFATWTMRVAYVDGMVAAVRRGLGDVFTAASRSPTPPTVGADGRRLLTDALAAGDARSRRTVVDVLGRLDGDMPIELLVRAAADSDAGVRRAAVQALADHDDPRAATTVRDAVDDRDADVRRAAVRAVGHRDPAAAVLTRVLRDDPAPAVRATSAALVRDAQARAVVSSMLWSDAPDEVAAALEAAAEWPDPTLDAVVRQLACDARSMIRFRAAGALAVRDDDAAADRLLHLLDDAEQAVRDAAAAALQPRTTCTDALLATLAHGSPRAQVAAVRALRGHRAGHDAVAAWARTRTERAHVIRGHRAQLASRASSAASTTYLAHVLAQREWQAVRDALAAIESLAGRDAVDLVGRAAHAPDVQLRAQAVEAVDSMAERPLSRRLIPLLEQEPAADRAVSEITAWAVLDDPDEWIRALAVRAALDEIDELRTRLRERAARDHSPLVIDALRSVQEDAMATSDHSSGLIDRMLALQRVPMLSELAPEDLAQVAHRCTERSYPADAVVYRQGDHGDEMFIITAGGVRVTRTVDGRIAVLRRYGPGEHVGELSLLRGRPRVADVLADAGGVDGLALDAASFRAILHDRPEVAIGMLATLAARIGDA